MVQSFHVGGDGCCLSRDIWKVWTGWWTDECGRLNVDDEVRIKKMQMENFNGKILKTLSVVTVLLIIMPGHFIEYRFYRISVKRSVLYFLFSDKTYPNILVLLGLKKSVISVDTVYS